MSRVYQIARELKSWLDALRWHWISLEDELSPDEMAELAQYLDSKERSFLKNRDGTTTPARKQL